RVAERYFAFPFFWNVDGHSQPVRGPQRSKSHAEFSVLVVCITSNLTNSFSPQPSMVSFQGWTPQLNASCRAWVHVKSLLRVADGFCNLDVRACTRIH